MAKPVMVIETGEIYGSRNKAAKALGCSDSTVSNAIKFGKSIKGFHLLDVNNQSNADSLDDATDNNVQACEMASNDEHDMLLKQLEIKDGQIKNLQSSISCLLMQLKDKDVHLDKMHEEISKLHQHLAQTQNYYAKALYLCEDRVDTLAASANSATQPPLSRREALHIALFGGNVTSQHMTNGKEA